MPISAAIAGRRISLKDFRTLVASTAVLEALAAAEPAGSQRARRSQVRTAVTAVAEELANTPTVCRKSYVHDAVINAFEQGALARPAQALALGDQASRSAGAHRRAPFGLARL
jgi:DNA topoisomerase-1